MGPAQTGEKAKGGGLGRRLGMRALAAGGTLLATLLLAFGLGQYTPGDAFSGLELDPNIPPAVLAHWRAEYLPQTALGQRWLAWVRAAAHGNFGYSLEYHRPVLSLLRERLPASLELMTAGLALAWGVGLGLALLPAWLGEYEQHRLARNLQRLFHTVAALLTALPAGVLALGALLLAPTAWLPAGGAGSLGLAGAVMALTFLPTVYLQAAHALTGILHRPFIFQIRAAGVRPGRVLARHALPNAADTLIPVVSLTLSQALVELVILEPLLGWPGLGQLSLDAAQNKDMPVLAALVLLTTLVVVTGNLMSDAVQYAWNPRRGTSLPAGEGGGGRVAAAAGR